MLLSLPGALIEGLYGTCCPISVDTYCKTLAINESVILGVQAQLDITLIPILYGTNAPVVKDIDALYRMSIWTISDARGVMFAPF
jgi:hypothetical protein